MGEPHHASQTIDLRLISPKRRIRIDPSAGGCLLACIRLPIWTVLRTHAFWPEGLPRLRRRSASRWLPSPLLHQSRSHSWLTTFGCCVFRVREANGRKLKQCRYLKVLLHLLTRESTIVYVPLLGRAAALLEPRNLCMPFR